MSETILRVKNLTISFRTLDGNVSAVRGVDFELKKGKHWLLSANQVLVSP